MSKEPLEQNTAGAAPIEPTAADFETAEMLPFQLVIALSYIAQMETGEEVPEDKRKLSYLGVWNAVSKIANPTTAADVDIIFDNAINDLGTIPRIPIEEDTDGQVPQAELRAALAFNWAKEHPTEIAKTIGRAAGVCKFFIFLNEEISKEEYGGKSLGEIQRESYDENKQFTKGSLFDRATAAANERLKAELPDGLKFQMQPLPNVTYKNSPNVRLSIDKLTTTFFAYNAPAPRKWDIDGQLSFDTSIPVKYERDGAPEITLLYNYKYDDEVLEKLHLEKKIDDDDYFVLNIIGHAYLLGNTSTSITKLFKDRFGYAPNGRQLNEFTNQLIKLATTSLFINDRAVKQAWMKDNPQATYKEIVTQVAPITVGTERFISNGGVVKGGVLIRQFPYILQIGQDTGQYASIPMTLLHVKNKDGRFVRQTKRLAKALHYLIKAIAQIKNDTRVNKILYSTYYDDIGETTTRGQQLAKTTMFTILDHFVREGWITGYKEETTKSTGEVGVKIDFDEKKEKRIRDAMRKKKLLQ